VFFGVCGALVVSVIGLGLFFPKTEQYQNGLLNPAGYPKIALFGAIVMAITIWYSAWGTRDQIPRLPKAPEDAPKVSISRTLGDVWKGYREASALLSFRAVFAGAACFTVAYGVTQTLMTHLNVFFWEFSAREQAALRLALLPGFFLGIALTRFAHKRFDKKACAVFGMLFITLAFHVPVALRLLGVLPHNGGAGLLGVVGFFLMCAGIAGGLAITTASSMMADVAQELEYHTGRSQQGVLLSAISLAQKIGSAAGHIVAGVGVDLIGFPTKATDVASIDPDLIARLGMLFMSAGAVGLLGVYAYSFYDLTHARHVESLKALQERRLAGAAVAAQSTPVPAT
jgi:Na+/melibiose symporter-like transporter